MRPPKVTLTIDFGSRTYVAPSVEEIDATPWSVEEAAKEAAKEVTRQLEAVTGKRDRKRF